MTIIKIWNYKWFISGYTHFVVNNFFKILKNIHLPSGLYAHAIQLFIIFTLSTFINSVEDMIVSSAFTITSTSASQPWDQVIINFQD